MHPFYTKGIKYVNIRKIIIYLRIYYQIIISINGISIVIVIVPEVVVT